MGNKERKKIRAENNDPINFTCGQCRRVVPFTKNYKCENCDVEEDENLNEVDKDGLPQV